jgi:hypothetical protein
MGESILVRKGGGVELTGNAATDDVLSGQTFYSNNASSKLTGTLALTGNATTAQVFSGQTFYSNNAKTRLTGTFVFDGNAVVGDVSTGKTFYATNGTKLTGTGQLLNTITYSPIPSVLNVYGVNGGTFGHAVDSQNIYVMNGGRWIDKLFKNNFTYIQTTSQLSGGGMGKVTVSNTHVYGVGSGRTEVYHKANMVFAGFITYNNSGGVVMSNNGVAYMAGIENFSSYFGRIARFGTTAISVFSSNIGNPYDLNAANNFIYSMGEDLPTYFSSIRKFHEGNLTFVGNSANLGFKGLGIAVSDGFIYVGVNSSTVRKYHEANYAFVANTPVIFSNISPRVVVKNNFIYAFANIFCKIYHTSNMAFFSNGPFLGSEFSPTFLVDNDNLYTTNGASLLVSSLNTPEVNINNVNYRLVPK